MPGVKVDVEIHGVNEQLQNLEDLDGRATGHITTAMRATVAIGKQQWIKDLSAVAQANLSAMISGLGGNVQALAPANPATPKKVISTDVTVSGPMDVTGKIYSLSKRYIRMGEVGRGPGKHPPVRALTGWAENVMGIPAGKESKAVGRELSHAIAKYGVKPTPVTADTAGKIQEKAMPEFQRAGEKIVNDLAVK